MNKSKSPSSTQTRVAAVAYLNKRDEFSLHLMKHHRTKHKRYLNADQKETKQEENIKDFSVRKGASSKHLTMAYITNNVFICDGGEYMSTVKDNLYTDENIYLHQIGPKYVGSLFCT